MDQSADVSVPVRPWYLAAFLIGAALIVGLGTLINAFSAPVLMSKMPQGARWVVPVFLAIGAVRLFAIYRAWHWSRSGVFLFAGCTIVASLVSLFAGLPLRFVLGPLFGLVVLSLVVRPAWKHFK